MKMVQLVRSGISQREVARRFHVTLDTVQRWMERSKGHALHRVDWSDRSRASHCVHNRTSSETEEAIITCRRRLASAEDALGFVGPEAISDTLRREGVAAPRPRTIARILKRRGILDHKVRRRNVAPPPGWYLPDVAEGCADIDAFDVIEDLVIEGKGRIDVLTAVTLWGPQVQAWPAKTIHAHTIVEQLVSYWRTVGLPLYAQFDNDTRFQGGHNHPDVIGRVMRLCLSLGVIPIFAPPQETGFQAHIESFNGLWQRKVWHRFHHEDIAALCERSERFISAYVRCRAARADRIPERRPFPKDWTFNLQQHPQGKIVYIRRTDGAGNIFMLGRRFAIDHNWVHRLVRGEVDLTNGVINAFRLRRREPEDQPLLVTINYRLLKRRFLE